MKPKDKMYEVVTQFAASAPAALERQIYWPGGRGILIVNINGSGTSAALKVDSVYRQPDVYTTTSGWNMVAPALKVGGASSFATDGEFEVELPECTIQFQVELTGGDAISGLHAFLLPIE